MKRTLPVFIIFLIIAQLNAISQTIIKGVVKNKAGEAMIGVNIYIKDSYDGASTDANGQFEFEAYDNGQAILVASMISYKVFNKKVELNGDTIICNPIMETKLSKTNAVTVSAGSFEAGDEKKAVILSSLDIVTTAGAGADIMAAMQTLPGANMSGGNTGLYVRGGSGREAVTIIDGLEVPHPYYSAVPDISSRGRFSPIMFQGTYFSSGGYSAEYGQGMSSALVLNSIDLPPRSFTSLGLMTLGMELGHTEKWENTSIGVTGGYYNLGPHTSLLKQNVDWDKAPIGSNVSMMFRHKTSETGILKMYSLYDFGSVSIFNTDPDRPGEKIPFSMDNNNIFSNISYKEALDEDWFFFGALSFSWNDDDIDTDGANIGVMDRVIQGKVKANRMIGEISSINFGAEFRNYQYENAFNNFAMETNENFSAAFAEADLYFSEDLIFRAGLRGEYSELIKASNFAPRLSFAYKTGENSQFSLAYGQFFQKAPLDYIRAGNIRDYEKASHFIANYQTIGDKRIFRIEAYYKDYHNLIKTVPDTSLNGTGDAKGIDVFWRDKETLDFCDYWISYSYTDTERRYLYYPVSVMPDYATKHNFNIVFKRWIPSIATSLSLTYNFASGRPYFNPNNDEFLADFTDDYHKLSISASYLTQIFDAFTIVVLSVDNVFGRENVFSYRYSADGQTRLPVLASENISAFFGIFISLGRDNTEDI